MDNIKMIDLEEFLKKNIHMLPDLPMIKFKKDHVEYEVTDIRCLNEKAIFVFKTIIEKIKENPECNEWTFVISEEVENDTADLVTDIIMALSVKARKRGKNGFFVSSNLLDCSAHRHKDEGKRLVTYSSNQHRVKTIWECIKDKKEVSMCDIAVSVANEDLEQIIEHVKGLAEK